MINGMTHAVLYARDRDGIEFEASPRRRPDEKETCA